MKRSLLMLATVALIGAFAVMAQTPESGGDEEFLAEFARVNAAEVEAGTLAERQSQDADVKAYARQMVDEHSSTLRDIEAIAHRLNIDVESKPDLRTSSSTPGVDRVRSLELDDAYLKSQVENHARVIDMLQNEIQVGRNASVKQLAANALPDIREHLSMARKLLGQISHILETERTS